ncbi:MAG TPA: phosphotransferase [Gemmatimonadaceae bacterium]|nr:phosphotransferase [Gemmatimonadaceae bacterium]
MTPTSRLAPVGAVIAHLDGRPPRQLRVERRVLRGGLEAAGVAQLSARYRDRHGRERVRRVVEKRLAGPSTREAAIYEAFVVSHVGDLSPRLLAVERVAPGRAVLYLESLRRASSWPWRDRQASQHVLDRAARLHECVPHDDGMAALADWDYEAELQEMAALTVDRLEQVRRRPALRRFGGGLRWARRLATSLRQLRRQLLAGGPLGRAVVHGDLHPGNVVVRRRAGRVEPMLLDWGRARIGSPLEDVSCWLHSLGTWEPEARRRHDTLLAGYLTARGLEARLTAELRASYWLASASNALSGALLHHLSVLLGERHSATVRASAAYAARRWVQVLRRADACWC